MTLKNFLVLVLGAVFLVSCNFHKDEEKKIDYLPAVTQEGKNTFGAYVNGELFASKNAGRYNYLGSNLTRFEETYLDEESMGRKKGYYFSITVNTNSVNPDKAKYLSFSFAGINKIKQDSVYLINGKNVVASYSETLITNCKKIKSGGTWCENKHNKMVANQGYIKITKRKIISDINRGKPYDVVLSGLFSFSGTDEEGKEIKVTDGRFDVTATTNYID
ncbi:hypothetical protein EDM00_02150 [Ornithobacterium rhinotracheale]|uniref:hypothetical protein n=1 Tax=Ornithobacterium rhinotracheale TaxID=28251 RepID=UPI00129CA7C9|nr:hypothetical protein [Ornithobacterium rhinotracheale]MRI62804.1 hypothetical protein [Ornithobacterium rhinotracheale]MRJ09858.1 hypothetical protein [Ornithobacterium rhinotracheale]